VELAAEIAHAHPGKEVVLAHNGPKLLHRLGLPDSCHTYAMEWFQAHGVRVLLGARMAAVGSTSPGSPTTDTSSPKDPASETFRSECGTHQLQDVGAVFWCTGAQPRTGIVRDSPALGPKCLTPSGFVRVDESMRVTGTTKIWALGDIADHPYEKQGYMAELTAEVAAANITNSLKAKPGKELRFPEDLFWPRKIPPTILAISLGPKDGLLIFNALVLYGLIARFAKGFVNVSKLAQICGQSWGLAVWWVAHPITYGAHCVMGLVQAIASAFSGLLTARA
jgi:NADH dehydrogenase FAD-containing subunit